MPRSGASFKSHCVATGTNDFQRFSCSIGRSTRHEQCFSGRDEEAGELRHPRELTHLRPSSWDDINNIVKPDVIVLDEVQRIKNWQTQTAPRVKSLRSPYAFVLTGTPVENRIDELYSIVQYLDPEIHGPLSRFNRDFYQLDERGRPVDYHNLAELRERLQPLLLRRRKTDVETQLPGRTVKNYFVPGRRAESALRRLLRSSQEADCEGAEASADQRRVRDPAEALCLHAHGL